MQNIETGLGVFFRQSFVGIMTGLELAWNILLQKFIVEAYSMAVIGLCKRGCNNHRVYYSLIMKIKSLAVRDWEVKFNHCYREGDYICC